MRCEYEMIPARSNFPVWQCVEEEGHDGWHSPGELTWEKRNQIKTAYSMEGKQLKGSKYSVLSSGEVALDEVVKINKNGSINQQSIMGKAAAILQYAPVEMKAGMSQYKKNDGPVQTHTWIEARGDKIRVVVSGTDIWYNGRRVSASELEEVLNDDDRGN